MTHTVQVEGTEPKTYLGFTLHPRSTGSGPSDRIAVAWRGGGALAVYRVDTGVASDVVVAEIIRYLHDHYGGIPDNVTIYSAESSDTTLAETPAYRAGRVSQLQREMNDALGQLGDVAIALEAAGAPVGLKLDDQVRWLKAHSSPARIGTQLVLAANGGEDP